MTFVPWYRYAHQKTCSAQRTLVYSDDPMRVRLERAYTHSLAVIKPDEFPPELQGQFVAIRTALTWHEDAGQGRIKATFAAISDDEVWRVAGLILDLHTAVSQEDGVHLERTRTAPRPAPAVVAPPEPDPGDMPAREIADLLRDTLPAAKLTEVVDVLASQLPGSRFLSRVRRKRRSETSPRRVLGVGSNDPDEKQGKP